VADNGAMQAWFTAVDLGARGRYSEATELLRSMCDHGRWGSLARSTRASHCRQVGAPSREYDVQALALAADPESTAEALIGLAADSIAEGSLDDVPEVLHRARTDADVHWRTATRWRWVHAELALAQADSITARRWAREAVTLCENRSRRHWAKSQIIAMAAGDEAALGQAHIVAQLLRDHGWITLQWPLALVLSDQPDAGENSAGVSGGAGSAPWWTDGVAAARQIERELSEPELTWWRTHPGVRRLHGT